MQKIQKKNTASTTLTSTINVHVRTFSLSVSMDSGMQFEEMRKKRKSLTVTLGSQHTYTGMTVRSDDDYFIFLFTFQTQLIHFLYALLVARSFRYSQSVLQQKFNWNRQAHPPGFCVCLALSGPACYCIKKKEWLDNQFQLCQSAHKGADLLSQPRPPPQCVLVKKRKKEPHYWCKTCECNLTRISGNTILFWHQIFPEGFI